MTTNLGSRMYTYNTPSALPDMIRCAADCGSVQSSAGRTSDCDEETVRSLRRAGWQVVNGAWTCPRDLPEDRRNRPGAMGRHPNPHCGHCGDTRGGPYGHETFECTWTGAAA